MDPETELSCHLLLIEDDARLASGVREYLENHGLSVVHEPRGDAGLELALAGGFDLVLLDLMLPGLDGVEVCRRLRAVSDVPVIMLTARGDELDRVLGLESGADDYMPKPFSPRELLARIRAAVRRARGRLGPAPAVVEVGDLRLCPDTLEATLGERPLELTAHQFAVLRALAERAGRVLGREQLIELAGGRADGVFDRAVDVQVSRLRQKLGDDPRRPRRIRTVRGRGYVYLPPSDA